MPNLPPTRLALAAPGRSFRDRLARFVDWAASSRSHRVICLVAGIWILNGFDLLMTLMSHEHGLLDEQNPVARHLFVYGAPSVILFKIGLVLVGTYPLLRYRRVRIVELGALTIVAAYAMLALRWYLCYELYMLSASNTVDWAEVQALGALPPPPG